jgi:beta-glucanase (GH16 family)
VFTDGTLGPFKVLTYPDAHIGGSGQFMTVYDRFSNGARQVTVHNGYMDLRATPRSDGLWDAVLVGTSQDGNGPTFGYGTFRYWLSFNIAPQTWQAAWLYDTTSWSATEIDFPEVLENQSLTAHVLGGGAGGRYGLPKPADLATVFHEFKVERRANFVAYSIDGVEVARITGTMPATKLAVLLDSKVGWPWLGAAGAPSIGTPDPTYLRVAAVTVDP